MLIERSSSVLRLYSLAEQTAILIAYTSDCFLSLPLSELQERKQELIRYCKANCAAAIRRIDQTGKLSPEDTEELTRASQAFIAQLEEDGYGDGA